MVSKEHIDLSNYIKEVHNNLRQETKLFGETLAWENHCKKKDMLAKYSRNMFQLATNYWVKNEENNLINNRIMWSVNVCRQYFLVNGYIFHRNKEENIAKMLNLHIDNFLGLDGEVKLKLLDVGSCYNPFKSYEIFQVTPIDIAPATSDVFQCDILKVPVGNEFVYGHHQQILQLPKNYFHAIIFSLLLEYLPIPKQRYLACLKAYNLLKFEGLLIIITPDSKHVGANVKIMKSWRHILAKMGLQRIKYEKLQHIHVMAFRKGLSKDITARWSLLHARDEIYEEMHIPQDFNQVDLVQKNKVVTETVDISLFEELPQLIND